MEIDTTMYLAPPFQRVITTNNKDLWGYDVMDYSDGTGKSNFMTGPANS